MAPNRNPGVSPRTHHRRHSPKGPARPIGGSDMTDTSGGEPAIAEVLTAINGLKVNGPEPVRALREDVLALGNRTQRLIDALRGDMDQRLGLLMDAIVDLRAGLKRTAGPSGMRRTGHLHPIGLP